jgi:hypothetical protein
MLCLLWIAPCRAADPLAGLLACRTISDAAARLVCFDRETAALDAKNAVPAAGAPAAAAPVAAAPTAAAPTAAAPVAAAPTAAAPTAAVPTAAAPVATAPGRPAPALDPKQQFGLPEHAVAEKEIAEGVRAADVSKIEAHILQLSQTANGRAVFTLDNKQVWRQLIADVTIFATPGDTVTISRGVLGSYWLQTKQGRGCKVTRVR